MAASTSAARHSVAANMLVVESSLGPCTIKRLQLRPKASVWSSGGALFLQFRECVLKRETLVCETKEKKRRRCALRSDWESWFACLPRSITPHKQAFPWLPCTPASAPTFSLMQYAKAIEADRETPALLVHVTQARCNRMGEGMRRHAETKSVGKTHHTQHTHNIHARAHTHTTHIRAHAHTHAHTHTHTHAHTHTNGSGHAEKL